MDGFTVSQSAIDEAREVREQNRRNRERREDARRFRSAEWQGTAADFYRSNICQWLDDLGDVEVKVRVEVVDG